MFRRSAILPLALCAVLLCPGLAAQEAEKKPARRPTYRVSVDDGSGEKKSKTFQGNIPKSELPRPPAPPSSKRNPAPTPVSSSQSSAPPPPILGTKLPDGRTLPFQLGNKSGSRSDSKNSREEDMLKSVFRREENLSTKNFGRGQWQGGKFSDHKDKNQSVIPWEQWEQKFSFWNKGGEQSALDVTNTFSAEIRERQTVAFGNYADGQRTSPISGDFSNLRNQDQRYEQGLHDRYLAQKSMPFKEMMTQRYQKLGNLSMQDINRYQFRQNRSSEPGVPAITPDGQMRK